ncbi:hypothetical protein ABUE34_12335 [Kozakia baliensis]|uniref:hypothetical protein n=1 Tax=Kozakia baliensis TaxID=153496 RepID=UPI00345B5B3E
MMIFLENFEKIQCIKEDITNNFVNEKFLDVIKKNNNEDIVDSWRNGISYQEIIEKIKEEKRMKENLLFAKEELCRFREQKNIILGNIADRFVYLIQRNFSKDEKYKYIPFVKSKIDEIKNEIKNDIKIEIHASKDLKIFLLPELTENYLNTNIEFIEDDRSEISISWDGGKAILNLRKENLNNGRDIS